MFSRQNFPNGITVNIYNCPEASFSGCGQLTGWCINTPPGIVHRHATTVLHFISTAKKKTVGTGIHTPNVPFFQGLLCKPQLKTFSFLLNKWGLWEIDKLPPLFITVFGIWKPSQRFKHTMPITGHGLSQRFGVIMVRHSISSWKRMKIPGAIYKNASCLDFI